MSKQLNEIIKLPYPDVLTVPDRPEMELYRTGSRDDASEIHALIAPDWDYLEEFNHLGETEPSVEAVVAATAETVQGMRVGTEVQYLIMADEKLVGRTGLTDIDREQKKARLSYWLGARFQGNGYAQHAAGRLIQFGFEEMGLLKVAIGLERHNTRSIKVAQSLGAYSTCYTDVITQKGRSIAYHRWEITK